MFYILALSTILIFTQPYDPCGLSAVECYSESREYIKAYIINEFKYAGLDEAKALKIIDCESNFKLDAFNLNRNGSNDLGIWQINSIHGLQDECRLSLKCSTDWTIKKVKHDGGFQAWSCNK